ncbi:MAG: gliding motility-associated C-terminal domain-containing protein [Crocinitomicaceae bacterium]|nr:gliding motility-associated C-terminal domain-containing protein [Crocinitomicaceae bacterium]
MTFRKKNIFLFISTLLVCSYFFSQNLLPNGSFELGGPGNGFVVDGAGYNLVSPPFSGASNNGDFAHVTNPNDFNSSFNIGADHTTGTGFMLVYDGNTTGGQQRFYKAGNNGGGICGLTVGQSYTFSYWIKSVSNDVTNNATRADVGVAFNNVSNFQLQSGITLAPLPADGWQQVVYSFTPSFNCVNIELFNNNTNGAGNNFAIDDLAVFAPTSPVSLTYSKVFGQCASSGGFIAGYAFNGEAPFTFSLSGPTNQTSNTGYFSGLPDGTYNLTVQDNLGDQEVISNIVLQSVNTGAFFLNANSTICLGDTLILEASGGNGNYSWSSNPNDPSFLLINDSIAQVAPSQNTTYALGGIGANSNLIFNPSFGLGNSGFYSDYFISSSNPSGAQGVVGVASDPSLFFNQFDNCTDQDGNDAMLVVDGATFNTPTAIVWKQAVPVIPNTTYSFSYWATSVTNNNPAELRSSINGVIQNTTTLSNTTCNWQQITFNWNSGNDTIAIIDINNLNFEAAGNDFALDNFSFTGATNCNLTIEVVTPQNLIIAASNAPVCAGDSIVLTSNALGTADWILPSGATQQASDITLSNVSLADQGLYEVIALDSNQCQAQGTFILDVFQGPTITLTTEDVQCFGGSNGEAEATVVGANPFSFLWSAGGTANITQGLSAGSYTLEVTDDNGCISNAAFEIIEPDSLVLNIIINDSDCLIPDGSAEVIVNGGVPNYEFDWSTGGTGQIETSLGQGSYALTVTDGNGCSVTDSFTVNAANAPDVSLVSVQDVLCFGDATGNAEIQVTGGQTPYLVEWSASGQFGNFLENVLAGNYVATITDDNGCEISFSVEITQPNPINPTVEIKDSECGLNNGQISIDLAGGTPTFTYEWIPAVSNTNMANNLSADDYQVVILDANDCETIINVTVGLVGNIPLSIAPNNVTIEEGDNIQLTADIGGITHFSVIWSPESGLSCTDCLNPIASPTETTTYLVIINTPDGCQIQDSVTVFVEEACEEIQAPTIFSPNGDGNNDFFCLFGTCIENLEFTIYNRWGEEIFKTNDPVVCWDGTFKGALLNSGVYVYQVIASVKGQRVVQSGNVTLVR